MFSSVLSHDTELTIYTVHMGEWPTEDGVTVGVVGDVEGEGEEVLSQVYLDVTRTCAL